VKDWIEGVEVEKDRTYPANSFADQPRGRLHFVRYYVLIDRTRKVKASIITAP